jgi:DNA-binding response OmpR family regulator
MTNSVSTILCIEDEPEMIELFRLILGRSNYNVVGAASAQEGLVKAAEIRPDLILLDLMMPEMDGWEMCQRMRINKELRDIPVIVVTAKAQTIDRVLALKVAKVNDYITKPFGPQELLESVDGVLRGEAVKSSP